jgi:UDP-N-acetylmuramate--alanine ligase
MIALGASSAEHLPAGVGALVRSAAIGLDDPQVVEARRRGLPVLKYSELVGRLAPARRTLAVAGTHGKTSSAWMLYHVLVGIGRALGQNAPAPGALVGGTHRGLKTNAVVPADGGWFAVEACEYDRSFLQLQPEGAIVTNVEPDHLDYYGDLAALERAFARFTDRVHRDGLLVVGEQVPALVEESCRAPVWRLGRDLFIDLLGEVQGRFLFRLRAPGWATPTVALPVPGIFNVENAALALALAIGLAARTWRLDPRQAAVEAARALGEYAGTARRFESWGSVGSIDVVHDYAHHPTEVRATIEAARRALPARFLHVLFQPHQHSRTARFLSDFVESLRGADRVVVSDVYGARPHIDGQTRDDSQEAGAAELVRRLKLADVPAEAGGPLLGAVRTLSRGVHSGSAILVLGAGDIDGIRDDLLRELALRSTRTRGPLR